MILTCPECQTRYRFDEARLPERGVPVRCKRCGAVFRAYRPGHEPQARPAAAAGAPAQDAHSVRASSAAPAAQAESRPAGPVAPRVERAPAVPGKVTPTLPVQEGLAVPVTVVAPPPAAATPDVTRLTRIILSDIVIYSPAKAEKAIRDGKFLALYRNEVEEGRKMIRTRFPGNSAAISAFEQSLNELLEARRKELTEAAVSL